MMAQRCRLMTFTPVYEPTNAGQKSNLQSLLRFWKTSEYREWQRSCVRSLTMTRAPLQRELLRTLVRFGPEVRRCREWFNRPPTWQCSVCQRWGHTTYNCRARSSFCAVCAEPHPTSAHHYSCKSEGCAGKCQCETERCINCKGHHGADSNTCPFWLAKSNPTKMKELIDKKQKEQEATRAPKKDSTTSMAKGKRPAVFSGNHFSKFAEDDAVPSHVNVGLDCL